MPVKGFLSAKEGMLLADCAGAVQHGGTIVEIGSYLGKSTVIMAMNASVKTTIYAIDAWDNRNMGKEPKRDTFAEFSENTRHVRDRVVPIRGDSKDIGSKWDKPIDMLFIDGDHSEPGAFSDLFRFAPMIKKGGKLLMHDYTEAGCGVKAAFEGYAPVYMKNSVKRKKVVDSMLFVELV